MFVPLGFPDRDVRNNERPQPALRVKKNLCLQADGLTNRVLVVDTRVGISRAACSKGFT